MKKNLMIAATATALSLGAIVPVGMSMAASAASDTSGSSIVDKIASKFNLSRTDVQKVFDEERASHQAEREQKSKDELTALVKAGTLTQAQADKLTAKRAEIKADMDANRDAIKNKTEAERKTAMDAKKAELDAWAKSNGIDAKYLMLGHGGMGHGPRGDMPKN